MYVNISVYKDICIYNDRFLCLHDVYNGKIFYQKFNKIPQDFRCAFITDILAEPFLEMSNPSIHQGTCCSKDR